MTKELEMATFGGGCFWCTEAVFQEVKGVHSVISGYAGGTVENPTYYQICTGTTGHAEVIQITFDADVISYAEILDVFWRTHDPTTLNRQGADSGPQYRSVIFYHNDQQRAIAEQVKRDLQASRVWKQPIVTEIVPLTNFYAAEDYHQDYYQQNRYQPYCYVVIDPKLKKFRKDFTDKLKGVVSR